MDQPHLGELIYILFGSFQRCFIQLRVNYLTHLLHVKIKGNLRTSIVLHIKNNKYLLERKQKTYHKICSRSLTKIPVLYPFRYFDSQLQMKTPYKAENNSLEARLSLRLPSGK